MTQTPKEEMTFAGNWTETWLDRTQKGLHRFIWRTARSIDSWMGPPHAEEVYRDQASGSLALAMLWDETDGFDPKIRFRVDFPLPQINDRLKVYVGRMNRDEFVTERDQPSGAFPRERSSGFDEDQTLAGLVYTRPERNGGSFSASAGARTRSSALDPYVKASYRYRRDLGNQTLFTIKETLFYQMSEKFGLTTRVDLDRLFGEFWMVSWTGSGTFSEGTEGVRGFTMLTATRALPGNRAVVARIQAEVDTGEPVSLHDFGIKVAYRKSVIREWLVLELRTSLAWPKKLPEQSRKPSWGLGVGFEMYFGGEEFTTRPVTF